MATEFDQHWARWQQAAAEPVVDAALRTMLDDLDAEVTARSPTCWLSGKCCHFESYGHRLYVTGLEVAWTVLQLSDDDRARLSDAELPGMDGCPFQMDKLCGVHAVRPMGCRIYYCDPTAQDWQQGVYETYQQKVRALHEAHGLAYVYADWRVLLDGARGG